MKITGLRTWRFDIQPNLLVLQLQTDAGVVGTGEAFFGAAPVESYLHDVAATVLFQLDGPSPERAAKALTPYVGYQGGGVETRGNGAVDLALWDLLGQRAGMPVVELLGGPVRDDVRVYNTCAGPGYVSTSSQQRSANWGLPDNASGLEDLAAFLDHPGRLASELLAEGIPGMKVWPFDLGAEESGGTRISRPALKRGLATVAAIRDAVGDDMELMVELHGLWDRPAATEICRALEPFRPMWVEDPLRGDAVDAFVALSESVDVPIATGETCVGRRGLLPLLQAGAVDVVTIDVQWTGGLTEARKVASLTDAFSVPVAPHDCTGPVTLAAAAALTLSQPNGLIQETVRAFLRTWYSTLASGVPTVEAGRLRLAPTPGLGVILREDVLSEPGMQSRESHV